MKARAMNGPSELDTISPQLFETSNDAARAVSAGTKRVLFVEGEADALERLRQTVQNLPVEWQIEFCTSGRRALEQLDQSDFDVIVTGMHMPDMDGFELLSEVLRRYPSMVRIALSGTVRQDRAIRSAGPAHQYLPKPCDAATLRAALDTALRIREMLVSPKLRTLISRITSLPALSSVHTKLIESLGNPEITSRELGEIIAQDVGLTAKTLQMANSAFFGLYRYIASPTEAAVYLGIDTIRALTLSTGVFSAFRHTGLTPVFIGQLQRHSVATGIVAHAIANAENLPKKACDGSLVGGLLHDVGKLALAANCPKEYGDVLAAAGKQGVTFNELEQQVFGATHADVGAYLLWLWGLPESVCQAVAFHHRPVECSAPGFDAAGVIHVADALEHECSGNTVDPDLNYLTSMGLAEHLPEWRRLCVKYSDRQEPA